nr:hypothetical protein [Enterobacter hormaechei]
MLWGDELGGPSRASRMSYRSHRQNTISQILTVTFIVRE